MEKQKYHYVYRITNKILNKHYYGSRTSKTEPKYDLGINYFSSSSVKEFIQDQKLNNQNYKYVIVRIFNSRNEALLFESHLHSKFNVAKNDKFYNKSNVTTTGFIYGFLGKKHKPESRKNAITKKVNTMKTTVNDNGENLYNLAAKKGDETKRNTITSDGLNIHQLAAKKYKERLDIIKDGETMSTRDKLKRPKKDKTNYQKEAEIIHIYNNKNELIYVVTINLRKFCKEHKLPYTELYNSKRNNTKLYENITDKRIITRLTNKDFYKYKNWYAIKQ
jgi:hypothetical protein